jgi:hypothetical protein
MVSNYQNLLIRNFIDIQNYNKNKLLF